MKIISKYIEAHIFRELNNKIEFLLLKRGEHEIYPSIWQMVSGEIKENETAVETAIREIKEETGLVPVQFWIVPNTNSFYSKDDDAISMLPVFAAKVSNKAQVVFSEEHTEFQWVDVEKAKKMLAWPGQIHSVDIIYEYLTEHKNYLKLIEIML